MTATVTAAPTVRPAPARGRSALAGTRTLVRFMLRRDRVGIPAWVLSLTLLTVGTAAAYPDLYPTAADRQAQAQVVGGNPAMVAMSGPGYGLDDYTYGAMMTNEMLGFVAVLVALMSILLVARHTRAEEEAGRTELVRAGVVGRHAVTTAALLTAAGANAAVGLLVALGFGGLGVESMTWTGSLTFGVSLASVGLVFAAVMAFTAQLTQHARAASGLAGVLIGVAYLLRALGDMGGSSLAWLSPIGWAQGTRAFVDERWWPLLLSLAATGAFVWGAYAVGGRRDIGAGMLQPRRGPASGSAFLGTSPGFALRLQRPALVGWAVAMAAFGAVYGTAATVIEDYADNEIIRQMMSGVPGASLTESWLSMIISVLAMVCTIPAILAALRLRSEETSGRAEPVLATGLSRGRWYAGHVAVALVGGTVVLVITGLGLAVTAAASTGDTALLGRVTVAAAAYAPALWLTAGLAAAVVGVLPRAVPLAWGLLVYSITLGYLGTILRFPEWAFRLSPYARVPTMGEDFAATPLLVLAGLAAGLVAVGLVGIRRRDIGAG